MLLVLQMYHRNTPWEEHRCVQYHPGGSLCRVLHQLLYRPTARGPEVCLSKLLFSIRSRRPTPQHLPARRSPHKSLHRVWFPAIHRSPWAAQWCFLLKAAPWCFLLFGAAQWRFLLMLLCTSRLPQWWCRLNHRRLWWFCPWHILPVMQLLVHRHSKTQPRRQGLSYRTPSCTRLRNPSQRHQNPMRPSRDACRNCGRRTRHCVRVVPRAWESVLRQRHRFPSRWLPRTRLGQCRYPTYKLLG
mmetsp:Transcript_36588/g.101561  ORF Transcript_36588/g.101561 Transcript_36588/m.101561 type:complete len:243 (-) Transcript_36588:350-1078(-)